MGGREGGGEREREGREGEGSEGLRRNIHDIIVWATIILK